MPTRTTIFATNDNVTANDLNSLAGAWNSYTPQVDQGASTNIAKTVTYAKYLQFGKFIVGSLRLSMTGTGTAGSTITVTTPVTTYTTGLTVGTGFYNDNGTNYYPAMAALESYSKFHLIRLDAPFNGQIGYDPNLAVANGDIIQFTFMYEAA